MGNDIYARSVYVGGTAACIEAILGEPRLESVPVAAADVVLPEDR